VRRLVALLLFLVIVDEGDATTEYSKHVFAPFQWVNGSLLAPLPIKVRVFDLVMLAVLVVASSKRSGKERLVKPMRNALLLAVATVVTWFIYGIATGGDARAASWQTYLLLSTVLVSFAIAASFRTVEHFALLGKAIVAAALYRAALCWYFYFAYVRPGTMLPAPDYMAAHDDSVVWVIVVLMMLVQALSQRKRGTAIRAAAVIVFLVGAIQWNHRRLAWVSLTMGCVMAFFLLPQGAIRRRVVRILRILVPVFAVYALVGWGRSESVFRPLQAFASVSTAEDLSTKARNAENLGLIATVRSAGALAGTGWGHGYIELTNKYSIAAFTELWPYVPHNSVLGLLAYTGILGFMGYWLAFPTAVFLNSRIAQLGNSVSARNVGVIAATSMIVCGNQMYGDMGIFSFRTMYLLATTYAIALRLPFPTGVWDVVKKKIVEPPDGGAKVPG
jgi:hypothetical protein